MNYLLEGGDAGLLRRKHGTLPIGPSGGGCWLIAQAGSISAFGDAASKGSFGALKLNRRAAAALIPVGDLGGSGTLLPGLPDGRRPWRGARAAESDGLENRCGGNLTVGSNPTPSAN